jgi:D-amino peptidase
MRPDESAKAALSNWKTAPYRPQGPFKAVATLRDGKKAAAKIADRWNFRRVGRDIVLEADDMETLYMDLIRACYLTPGVERLLPTGLLRFYNLVGKIGLKLASRHYKSSTSPMITASQRRIRPNSFMETLANA